MKTVNKNKVFILYCIAMMAFYSNSYAQCSEGCEISFGSTAGLLTGFTDVTGNNDILNMNAVPLTLTQSFDVYDETDCTCPVVGGGGVDDITLTMTIDDNTQDAYGGVSFDYNGTTLTDINQSTSGLVGLIDFDNTGTRDISTGDYMCYTIEVDFAPHLHQLAENICIPANSINTGGEHFESTTIVFWDDTDTPYGTVDYQGFYEDPDGDGGDHPGTTLDCMALNPTNDNLTAATAVYTDAGGAIEASTQPGVFVAAETTTVIADDNPGGNGNANTCEVEPGPDGSFDGGSTGVSIEAVANAGLDNCDIVGGFTFMVCIEDVSTTTTDTADDSADDGDGVATGSDTGFTSTLRGFNFSPVCCPEIQTIPDFYALACPPPNLGSTVVGWKNSIETTDGTGAIVNSAVAPATASIRYSLVPNLAGTYDNDSFVQFGPEQINNHSGVGCETETYEKYAYVRCSKGNTTCGDFENYEITLVSTLTLEFYPPPRAPIIVRDDDACAYSIMPVCPNDVISPSTITAMPGDDPPATDFTVTTEDGCADMFSIDPEACPVAAVPSIMIDKDDADDTNDTQIVEVGTDATFTITVTNDGTVSLENVVITDALSPGCDMDATMTAAAIMAIGNGDAIFDPMESFTYTCMTTGGVPADFTNTAMVNANPVGDTTIDVSDMDDTEVFAVCVCDADGGKF